MELCAGGMALQTIDTHIPHTLIHTMQSTATPRLRRLVLLLTRLRSLALLLALAHLN